VSTALVYVVFDGCEISARMRVFSCTSKARLPAVGMTYDSVLAVDRVVVSISGGLPALLKSQHLENSNEIETLEIRHRNLTIEMIIVLASTLASHCPGYNLYKDQCYWFASTLWDMTIDLAKAGNDHNITYTKKVDRPIRIWNTPPRFLTLAVPVDDVDKPAAMRPKYDKAWHKFCARVEPLRGVSCGRCLVSWIVLNLRVVAW
jgi:hypothetical protein